MRVASSLKSLKKEISIQKWFEDEAKFILLIKKPKFKARQG